MSQFLKIVAIDLTPVRPGGENGGAKVMTLELIRALGELAPQAEFILLTTASSHDELAYLEARNVRRKLFRSETRVRAMLERALRGRVLRDLNADLLLCPLTEPYFHDPRVPTVSVIYDLQYTEHPEFFSAEELAERDRHMRAAAAAADRLVCISEYTRSKVMEKLGVSPDRTATIYIQAARRLPEISDESAAATLSKFDLQRGSYLIYPANFWRHKNHENLLRAFTHAPGSLKLVLTGWPGDRMAQLQAFARDLGIDSRVCFAGYVGDAALLQNALALIFPSLYEGFGMPLLEAMHVGVPVLSSNATSLPEVGGDAAIYFDPNRPDEIAAAIARIASDDALRTDLIARGRHRAAAWGGPREMAAAYLQVFEEVIKSFNRSHQKV